MDCSMQGFPVLHCLPEFAQTHVQGFRDGIQPSHPLLPPSPPALYLSQHQGLSIHSARLSPLLWTALFPLISLIRSLSYPLSSFFLILSNIFTVSVFLLPNSPTVYFHHSIWNHQILFLMKLLLKLKYLLLPNSPKFPCVLWRYVCVCVWFLWLYFWEEPWREI